MNPKPLGGRLPFIDWSRGLAAVVMLQGHVFHSFTSKNLRDDAPYVLSQFIGGVTPAMFLFLTGVTLAFLMDSKERKGVPAGSRVLASLRRAGYLFALAIAFRLQLWAFGYPHSHWTDLFKVDILNSMGFGIALMSVMAVFSTVERVRLCTVLGIGIAAASPLITNLNWAPVPTLIKQYIAPDQNAFTFFPWAAFLAFGLAGGSILRLIGADHLNKVMQWSAIAGMAIIFGAHYFSNFPYALYPKSEFWLDSPWLIFIKMGVILVVLAFAYLWTMHSANSWSWVAQLGTTSLLVYWVHIELVYGRWFGFWKESLNVSHTIILSIIVIALMVGLSWIRTNWKNIKPYLTPRFPEPGSASGD
jgi:uncharacterized membrane protein